MLIRAIALCFCVCLVSAIAGAQPYSNPRLQASWCARITRDVDDYLVAYERDRRELMAAEDALKFWTARHDQLLSEQTAYSRSHLEPSPGIQRSLIYAQGEIRAKQSLINTLSKTFMDDFQRGKSGYEMDVEGGCMESTWDTIRMSLAEHPGQLANEIRVMHAAHVAAGTTVKAVSGSKWNGLYTNSSQQVRVVGSTQGLAAASKYTEPGRTFDEQGVSDEYQCTAESEGTFKCRTSGEYHDADKAIQFTGTATLTFSGRSLTISEDIADATCSPKKQGISSCDQLGYIPAVHAGAHSGSTLTRR